MSVTSGKPIFKSVYYVIYYYVTSFRDVKVSTKMLIRVFIGLSCYAHICGFTQYNVLLLYVFNLGFKKYSIIIRAE